MKVETYSGEAGTGFKLKSFTPVWTLINISDKAKNKLKLLCVN